MLTRTVIVSALVALCVSHVSATVLYDGSLGSKPGDQGWQYLALDFSDNLVEANQTWASNKTTLDTTGQITNYAGYGSHDLPGNSNLPSYSLNRTDGFRLTFDLRIVSEAHDNDDRNSDGVNDRAGFSVVAIAGDLKGIEIGFWEGEVWAYDYQNVGGNMEFVHDEGEAFDPTAGVIRYELEVAAGATTYTLSADGNSILTGNLRNYSGQGIPYNRADYLAFSDNTSKAKSKTELARIEVIPEPGAMVLLGMVGTAMLSRRRRRAGRCS
ncbi:MAG TPA: PEP-CTERM sorting domain-containing protein [Phycisphaerae bacterium]|nr:PEP-CTERM sorting domain-containing protein [Phycisphaerae bacterium]